MKDLLKSLSTLSEAETKDTKTGRVHRGDYGTSYDGDDEKKPAASTEKRGRGRPKKGADDSGEVKSYDTKSLGSVFGGGQKPKKDVGTVSKKHSLKEYLDAAEEAINEEEQVQIKPAQQNTQVIQQGNKTLGTVTNPQLANQIKQAIGQGQLNISGVEQDGDMTEEVDTGEYDARKSVPHGEQSHDWDQNFRDKLKQFTKELAQHVAQTEQNMSEGKKPDFLDVDKDKNKKESFKKAVADKEARKKVAESISFNEMNAESQETAQEMLAELQDDIETFVNTGHCSDKLEAFLKVHGHAKKKITDEGAAQDFAIHGVKPTNDFTRTSTSMAVPRGTPTTANRPVAEPTPFGTDPIAATTDRAINFISGLRKPSNPFSESTNMKDIQLESWESQLDSLLTEGITVSSSQGQQGAPDSVTITATDSDSDQLLNVLRQSGLGVFGGNEKPDMGYGVASQGEEEFTGTGTEPQPAPGVVGDGDDMLSMMKKMAGIEDGPSGAEQGGQDYEDEEGAEPGTLEPADGDEEEDKEETDEGVVGAALGGVAGAALGKTPSAAISGASLGSDIQDELSGDDEVEEGNAFSGAVAKAKQDGVQPGEKINVGGKDYPVKEEEETCNECGCAMQEGHACDSEQVEETFSNEVGGDAMSQTELMKLKALLGMGNDMHRPKHSQATGNVQKVTMETKLMKDSSNLLSDYKKLSGL